MQIAVEAARSAVSSAPERVEVSPLAARLGVRPDILDLLAAGLLSIGSNLLGAVLVAFGARRTEHTWHTPAAVDQRVNNDRLRPQISSAEPKQTQVMQAVNIDGTYPTDGGTPVASGRRATAVLKLVSNNGEWHGTQSELARQSGVSQATASRVLKALAADGVIDLETSKQTGTSVKLRKHCA